MPTQTEIRLARRHRSACCGSTITLRDDTAEHCDECGKPCRVQAEQNSSTLSSGLPKAAESSHTPTPWTVSVEEYEADLDGRVTAGMICIYEINRMIHDTDWADSDDWDRDMANADFIVRAVNSYDASQRLIQEMVETLNGVREVAEHCDNWWKAARLKDLMPSIRAVIAKAEGK